MNKNAFINGYRAALMGATPDTYTGERLYSAAALDRTAADCGRFIEENRAALEAAVTRPGYDWGPAGYDFWLSRGGYSLGFWCRLELIADGLGNTLTSACLNHPAQRPYVGADGLIYL